MAWRLANSVVRGELDNRVEGRVLGKIWLLGNDEPLILDLQGNCLRDIAGSRIEFTAPAPEPDDELSDLNYLQEGCVGDMTASRRIKILDMPVEEAYSMRKQGLTVPTKTANALYVEWFSEANGRVVIETVDFELTDISERTWRMSKDEEIQQVSRNFEAIKDYIVRMDESRHEMWENSDDDKPYKPMDEFEWERGLKESDAIAEKYSNLMDKYMDHPDRERIVAREMGWSWLEDALDAEARGVYDDEEKDAPPEHIDEEEDPDPLTEGIDWIRREDGRIVHPLADRAYRTALIIRRHCKELNLLDEDADEDLQNMIFSAQTLSAKLAGALNGLARYESRESGFIVAYLKRALRYFHDAIAHIEAVEKKKLVEPDHLSEFRKELFEIREEMLLIMSRFRSS